MVFEQLLLVLEHLYLLCLEGIYLRLCLSGHSLLLFSQLLDVGPVLLDLLLGYLLPLLQEFDVVLLSLLLY